MKQSTTRLPDAICLPFPEYAERLQGPRENYETVQREIIHAIRAGCITTAKTLRLIQAFSQGSRLSDIPPERYSAFLATFDVACQDPGTFLRPRPVPDISPPWSKAHSQNDF